MARRADALEFRMKLSAMRAERQVLLSLRSSQAINDETFNKLMREVDLSETALTARRK
jgi:CPA1 family monovalent cation:H+ antiporter